MYDQNEELYEMVNGDGGKALTGILRKEGRKLHLPVKRSFSLKEQQLICRKVSSFTTCWEVNVSNCQVERFQDKKIVISLPYRSLVLIAADEEERDRWADALLKAACSDISVFYNIGEVIGRGCFGEVRKATSLERKESVAVKVIMKKNCTSEDLHYLAREVDIVKDLNHENIVRTYDIFETSQTLYICMEYMGGGMLYDNISNMGQFTEKIASQVFRQILRGVQYLHDQGIAHRDIKPENILCSQQSWPFHVKLSDFGLSNFSGQPMQTRVGTPFFVAPEVLRGDSYGSSVDGWSCGVVLYNLLSGKLPFDSPGNPEQIFRSIMKGRFSFPDAEWSGMSQAPKDLITGFLTVNPQKRLTVKEALEHPWLQQNSVLPEVQIQNDLSDLHSSRRSLPRVPTQDVLTLNESVAIKV